MFPISPSSAARLASFTQQWRWLITSTTIVTYLHLLPSPLWLDPWRSQNSLPPTRRRSLHNNGGRQWGIPLNHWLQTDATYPAEACRGVECNQPKNWPREKKHGFIWSGGALGGEEVRRSEATNTTLFRSPKLLTYTRKQTAADCEMFPKTISRKPTPSTMALP